MEWSSFHHVLGTVWVCGNLCSVRRRIHQNHPKNISRTGISQEVSGEPTLHNGFLGDSIVQALLAKWVSFSTRVDETSWGLYGLKSSGRWVHGGRRRWMLEQDEDEDSLARMRGLWMERSCHGPRFWVLLAERAEIFIVGLPILPLNTHTRTIMLLMRENLGQRSREPGLQVQDWQILKEQTKIINRGKQTRSIQFLWTPYTPPP